MMHFLRTLYFNKTPLHATLKCITECQTAMIYGINFITRPQYRQFCENVRVKDAPISAMKETKRGGLLNKLLTRFTLYKKKYQLMALGYYLYNNIADKINYPIFFKDFNMPDTFYSWFLITELHVWMLMVRFMAEGERGKVVRNNIVEAMWNDVSIRIDMLGHIASQIKRRQIMEISYQFNAAVIGYDEGILSDDKVLAGALWRRYFCSECNNPEHLEKLLIYVRKQMSLLDKIPSEEIFNNSRIEWIDLKSIR